MTLLTTTDDFLTKDFKSKRFDLITVNPPWVKIGIEFIDKAACLLKPGGKLVGIIGYNQFTKQPTLKGPKMGSFLDMQNRGTFERIEVFKGMSKRDYFNNYGIKKPVGDWCWFIWKKQ